MARDRKKSNAEPASICPFCAKDYKVPVLKDEHPEWATIRRGLIRDIHFMQVACEKGSDALKAHLDKNYSDGDGGFYSKQQWIWSCVRQGGESDRIEADGRPMAPWKAWVIEHGCRKLWEWTTSRMEVEQKEQEGDLHGP